MSRFNLSVRSAQIHLFLFLGAVAAGTIFGGPIGDRFGRRRVILWSILGVLPFSLALPYVDLFWTRVLSVVIGLILASAFSAIIVYAQELVPGRVGTISGLFFGFAFGIAGIGAAVLGELADRTSIATVYLVCSYLPAIGVLGFWLPRSSFAKSAESRALLPSPPVLPSSLRCDDDSETCGFARPRPRFDTLSSVRRLPTRFSLHRRSERVQPGYHTLTGGVHDLDTSKTCRSKPTRPSYNQKHGRDCCCPATSCSGSNLRPAAQTTPATNRAGEPFPAPKESRDAACAATCEIAIGELIVGQTKPT